MRAFRPLSAAILSLFAVCGLAWAQVASLDRVHALREAVNTGDPGGFAAQFHEDGEVTLFGAEVARFPGTQAIRGWASYLVSVDTHLELWDCDQGGRTASCRFAVASDETRRMDLGVLEGTVVARFDDELVETFTIRFTDADHARYVAALEEANAALYRRLVDEVINGKNLGALDALVAEDFLDHDAPPGEPQGREALRETLAMIFEAFPDLRVTIDQIVADGSTVVAHGTARGTHTGAFMGIEPTEATVTWEYFDMGRVQNGVFVERWGLDDTLAILQQLGVVPSPSESP